MARWQITRRGWARILLVLLLGTVLGLTSLGPLWSWPARWAVRQEMDSRGIPGLSLAVAIDGQIRWSAGFGLADVENDVPARPTTVYRLASVSKPITAVAVLQLAERGVIDLDAPIQRYVPSFPEKAWPVTPRLLLSHLGGVRTYKGDELLSTRHFDSLTEALTIFKDDPLVSEPGTKHLYSTYGYNLLGAAVEGASGQSYEAYVREHIFEPAGMKLTRAADIDALIPGRAQGYFKGPGGTLRNSRPVDLSNKVPAAGLCATAEDLARFAIALQAGTLIGPETRRLMWTPQRTRDGQSFGYGLGWNLGRYAGCDYACHVGRQQRVTTLLYLLPERRFAVAMLCNLENSELIPLAQRIADLAAPAPSGPSSDATTGR
jgi:CubicO group peptidase (beta-lactamase class C family)